MSVVIVTGTERSVAVAPASVYVDPNSTVAGLSPVTVITGGVVSTTLTVLISCTAWSPLLSVALYIIEYVSITSAFTVPDLVTVISFPLLSVAVAPASVYVDPNSTVAGLLPFIIMTGLISDPGNSTSFDSLTIVVATLSVSSVESESSSTKSSSSACEITWTWTWFTWLELVTLLSLNTSAIIVEILESVVESIVAVSVLFTISFVAVVSVTRSLFEVELAIRSPNPLNKSASLFDSSDNREAVSIIVATWTLALCTANALATTSALLLSKLLI